MDWPRIAVPALAFLLSCGSFASAALAPAHARFQWPAAGRLVVASCGGDVRAREVTLALRPGAAIHATDSGRVAYAGNELKGFDSVIFIRHFGDWVSAYALSGTILVKRGDVVERGQAIALSDRTDLQVRTSCASHCDIAPCLSIHLTISGKPTVIGRSEVFAAVDLAGL